MKTVLKLCLVSALTVLTPGCAAWASKGPAITADGFKVLECVAAHYPELRDAGNVENVAILVAESCGADSAQVVLDIFGGMKRGLSRAGVHTEK